MYLFSKLNKFIVFIILVVFIYSIFINIQTPSITEEFTGNIRETFRPKIRTILNMSRSIKDKTYNKIKNIILKMNR